MVKKKSLLRCTPYLYNLPFTLSHVSSNSAIFTDGKKTRGYQINAYFNLNPTKYK